MKYYLKVIFCCFLFSTNLLHAQKAKKENLVYVDKEGVLRYTSDKKEAAFFGVNYTVPFAYGFRSHKTLGKDLRKAIDEDVYHFARLGLDAFRVHIWDVEITDSLGNLLKNEHLDLFDYLLKKLSERNIKTLITPIAFWGNGYPERDEKTIGFSSVYGKGQSVVKEEAIRAQENYLRQILEHVNPYTNTSYRADPNIIAIEINNEPHHSGPKEKTTEYVNRLAAAIRSTGWTKPVFYNISESPWYSDAIAKANVEGHSFQWYPSGLVAGQERKGNFLPHVDRYTIPFDSVPAYRKKARMVYEFDAADILQSYMYPAMARSYRTAGFQWCTQFAYDPLATAYGNTEYQTHYLNLAYTPSKAISLMIASKIFHRLPRLKSYGTFPADTVFDVFRVSYKGSLSEMNSVEEFYYSNSTSSRPLEPAKLKNIAGVGSSPVVEYEGTGAYFLDKIREGVWRLEVMPDIVQVRDPFERASPKKEVTRIEWAEQNMKLHIRDLAGSIHVTALDATNSYVVNNSKLVKAGDGFLVKPGVYYITDESHPRGQVLPMVGQIKMEEFIAPKTSSSELRLSHTPPREVSAGRPFTVQAIIAGVDTSTKITLEVRGGQRWRNIPFKKKVAGVYEAEVRNDAVLPGILAYRIIVQRGANEFVVFPGNVKGNPYAWDNPNTETWSTIVVPPATALEIFNTNTERTSLVQYNPDWRNNSIRFVPAATSSQLAVKVSAQKLNNNQVMGWQSYVGDKLAGRKSEIQNFKHIVVRVRADSAVTSKLGLVTDQALVFSHELNPGKEWKEIRIPIDAMRADSLLLLPRPYPGFLPLWFKSSATGSPDLSTLDRLQFVCYGEGKGIDVEVAWVRLEE